MNATTYGQLVNGETEYETEETVLEIPEWVQAIYDTSVDTNRDIPYFVDFRNQYYRDWEIVANGSSLSE